MYHMLSSNVYVLEKIFQVCFIRIFSCMDAKIELLWSR